MNHEQTIKNILKEEKMREALLQRDIEFLQKLSEQHAQLAWMLQNQVLMNRIENVCEDCSHCCETCDIELNIYDTERLASYLKISVQEFISKYCIEHSKTALYYHRLKNKPCAFLKNKKCIVYQVRPNVCVFYPFISTLQINTIKDYDHKRKLMIPIWCKAAEKTAQASKYIEEQRRILSDCGD